MLSSSKPTRTLTPPELKWLLNERAALQGRMAAYVQLQGELRTKVLRLEEKLQKWRAALTACTQAIEDVASTTAAFDLAMQVGFPHADPSAAGVIRGHTRYGKRGALTEFLQEHLREMSPRSFTATELRKVAIKRFGVVLLTQREQDRFRSCLRMTLLQIRDRQGTIENLSVGEPAQTRWRWKQAATLDDLRRMVERSSMTEEEPPDEPAPHPNKI